MKKIHDHEMLHTQTRYLELMERDRQLLIETFTKHMRRTDHHQNVRCPALPTLRDNVFQTAAQRYANEKRRVTR